ncbi:MAG: T9SS type A sorting domain-containing protein [Flavobacteriales bacterium]
MRKIYLSLFAALTVGLAAAQQKTAQNIGEAIPAKEVYSSAPSRGATIWSEDFANGIPTAWTNTTITGPVNWKYTTVGHTGGYPTAALISSTSNNGWILVDSDADNFSGGGPEHATLTTDAINCTGFANVKLEFQQMFRRWTSEVTSVFVSNNGTNWTQFVLNGSVTQAGTPNPDYVNIDISAIAGNQSTVYIRFSWQGSWDYGWQIDDVAVKEIDNNDILIKKPTFSDEIQYYRIPLAQVQPQYYAAFVENIGLQAQTNVNVDVVVNDGVSNVFTGTSNTVASMASWTQDSLYLANTYTPSALGTYSVNYTANQSETDEDPTNNSIALSYAVTDTVYAIDNGVYGGQWWNQDDGSGSAPFIIGAIYEIVANSVVSSISVFVGNNTAIGVVLNPYLYLDNNDGTFNYIQAAQDINVDANNRGTWVTVPLLAPAQVNSGSYYLAAVEHFGGSGAAYIGYSTNTSLRGSTVSSSDGGGTWANQPRTPMIRLNMNPSVGLKENTLISNMSVFPNPASNDFTLSYNLTESSSVVVTITDISGRVISSKNKGTLPAGNHLDVVSVNSLSQGIYNVSIATKDAIKTTKLVVTK